MPAVFRWRDVCAEGKGLRGKPFSGGDLGFPPWKRLSLIAARASRISAQFCALSFKTSKPRETPACCFITAGAERGFTATGPARAARSAPV